MADILVIDDEIDIRAMLGAVLSEEGHTVFQASDGDEAIALLGKHSFRLVILDIFMPRVNGLLVIEKIKSDYPGTKIIILSAITKYDANSYEVVIGEHAEGYLEKPVEIKTLLAKVRECL